MDKEPDLVFPIDVQTRMRTALIEDMDSRLKDLTTLVALQESELALLWVLFLGSLVYIVGKDYRERRQRNT
ncbi:MAG TPA: hypothetical protein VGF75_06325 [Candidatus Saccharimonadales bacterium]|jgi:hypothetical protein